MPPRRVRDLHLHARDARQTLGEALGEIHRTVMSPVAAERDLQLVAAVDTPAAMVSQ